MYFLINKRQNILEVTVIKKKKCKSLQKFLSDNEKDITPIKNKSSFLTFSLLNFA